MIHKCKLCGNIEDPEDYIPGFIRSKMESHRICFKCAFWLERKRLDDEIWEEVKESKVPSEPRLLDEQGNPIKMPERVPIIYEDEYGNRCHAIIPRISWNISSSRPDQGTWLLTKQGLFIRWTLDTSFQGYIPKHFYDMFPVNAHLLREGEMMEMTRHLPSLKSDSVYQEHIKNIIKKVFK